MFKATLSESYNGIIWKILLDEESNFIAIESRDATLRQVAFSVHNYQTGETLIKEKIVDEVWFSALAHIGFGYVFINGYEYAGSPVSKGITALSIYSKTISWQHYNLSFYDAWQEGLRVFNPNISPRKFEWIAPDTGKAIAIKNPTSLSNNIQLPEPVDVAFIPDIIKHDKIVGEVFHFEYQGVNILSFHELVEDYFQLRLVVYQLNSIHTDVILASRIQKLQPETFFVQHDHLFCIQNSNQIVSYKLV